MNNQNFLQLQINAIKKEIEKQSLTRQITEQIKEQIALNWIAQNAESFRKEMNS